jgi:hypothetical protein
VKIVTAEACCVEKTPKLRARPARTGRTPAIKEVAPVIVCEVREGVITIVGEK